MAKTRTSGQGRPKGVPNKATAELKDLARIHTPAAVAELARLAVGAESEQARVAAIKELLDRGHGKAPQSIGLGQAEDLEPIKTETTIRPTLSRDEWLKIHGGGE